MHVWIRKFLSVLFLELKIHMQNLKRYYKRDKLKKAILAIRILSYWCDEGYSCVNVYLNQLCIKILITIIILTIFTVKA